MKSAQDGNDVVDPRHCAECAAVPGDVCREVVAGAFRVAGSENLGDIVARDGLALVRR